MKTKNELKDLGKEYLNKADVFVKEKLNSTLKILGCSIVLGILVVFFWEFILSILFLVCIVIGVIYFRAPNDNIENK